MQFFCLIRPIGGFVCPWLTCLTAVVKGPEMGLFSLEEPNVPDDKTLLNMYTSVKRKDSSSSPKRKRALSNGSGMTRKSRLKNPFRIITQEPAANHSTATGQISCYFNTEGTGKPIQQEMDTVVPDTTGLPSLTTRKYDESGLSDLFVATKENSPSPEKMYSSPISSFSIPSYSSCNNLDRKQSGYCDSPEPKEDCSLLMDDSQRSSTSGLSNDAGVTNKVKRLLNFNSSQDNTKITNSCKTSASVGIINKFTYQPKTRVSEGSVSRTNDALNGSSGSSAFMGEVTDSGYLSGEEENTFADTFSDGQKVMNRDVRVQEDTISTPRASVSNVETTKRKIQLRNPPKVHKSTGLSRCKSLGISKRKSSIQPVLTGSTSSSLFNYFEFNKNKRPRLESS